jgi:hypothetical protein
MDQNLNNTAAPSSMTGVENLRRHGSFTSSSKRVLKIRAYVPPITQMLGLPLNADCPTPVAPYQGSPGCILLYGPNFTPSTVYFTTAVIRARYLLTSRF